MTIPFIAGQPIAGPEFSGGAYIDNDKLITPMTESGEFEHGSPICRARFYASNISTGTGNTKTYEIGVNQYGGGATSDVDETYKPEGDVVVTVGGDGSGGGTLSRSDFTDGRATVSVTMVPRCDRIGTIFLKVLGESDNGSGSYRPWITNHSSTINVSRSYFEADVAGQYAEDDARPKAAPEDPEPDPVSFTFTWKYKANADIIAKFPGVSLSPSRFSHVFENDDAGFGDLGNFKFPNPSCIACAVPGGVPYACWTNGIKSPMTRNIQSSVDAPDWYGGHNIEGYTDYSSHVVDGEVVYLSYGEECVPVTWRPIGWIHNPNDPDVAGHKLPSYTPASSRDYHTHADIDDPEFDHDIEDYAPAKDFNDMHRYHGVFFMTP